MHRITSAPHPRCIGGGHDRFIVTPWPSGQVVD